MIRRLVRAWAIRQFGLEFVDGDAAAASVNAAIRETVG